MTPKTRTAIIQEYEYYAQVRELLFAYMYIRENVYIWDKICTVYSNFKILIFVNFYLNSFIIF